MKTKERCSETKSCPCYCLIIDKRNGEGCVKCVCVYVCVREAASALKSPAFTQLLIGRERGGRKVRREKGDADCAASQHLFQADSFTGNWTKANSWGVVLVFAVGLGVCYFE